MVFDGVVLRRQAERVKAYREKDVVALHTLFAGDDVHRGIGSGVANVQPLPGGVRELDKGVELGLIAARHGGVGLRLLPALLPFLFYCCKIVFHFLSLSGKANLRFKVRVSPHSQAQCIMLNTKPLPREIFRHKCDAKVPMYIGTSSFQSAFRAEKLRGSIAFTRPEGEEGMREALPQSRSKGAQGYRTFWPRR